MSTRLGDSVHGKKVSVLPIVRELMLHTQNEMFAVAVSSMLAIDVRKPMSLLMVRFIVTTIEPKVKDLVLARSIYLTVIHSKRIMFEN